MRRLILAWALLGCAGEPAPSDLDLALDGSSTDGGGAPDLAPSDAASDAEPDQAMDAEAPDATLLDANPDALPDAAPSAPTVEVVPLGPQPLDTAIDLTLTEPADGLLIQARGPADAILGVVDAFGPPGRLIGPTGAEPGLRAAFNPGVAVALLPSAGGPPLPAGDYRFRIAALGAAAIESVEVEAWIRRGPAQAVRVNVWLPPALDLAPDDPAVDLFAAALAGRLGAFGLPDAVVQVGLLAEDAPAEARMDGLRRDFSGLAALAAARPADAPPGLELYLVADIVDGANRINGFTGGLPAPVGHADRPAAVVAVRAALLPDFPAAVADFAQHELGHALGLFHTTEPYGDQFDPLDDTAECPLACDADGDGVLFARECGAQGMGAPPCQGASDNVMFWTLGGQRAVTPSQRRVVGAHPLTALP